MGIAQHINIPLLITIHQVSSNVVIHQRRESFAIDKTDEIVAAVEAVAARSGKPIADVLQQFSLDLVKAKLANDRVLQKLITNFENQTKSKLRLEISLDGSVNW
jgi:hypothetical protein